ncbi:MAG: crossover junction endodeoxyribonuclease RuvC, partial [Pikeienuella sp.]
MLSTCWRAFQSIPIVKAAKTVKQAICGQGQATKTQMQNMVIRILSLTENPGEDAADALG